MTLTTKIVYRIFSIDYSSCSIGTDRERECEDHTLKCEFHFRESEVEIIESVTLNQQRPFGLYDWEKCKHNIRRQYLSQLKYYVFLLI